MIAATSLRLNCTLIDYCSPDSLWWWLCCWERKRASRRCSEEACSALNSLFRCWTPSRSH